MVDLNREEEYYLKFVYPIGSALQIGLTGEFVPLSCMMAFDSYGIKPSSHIVTLQG
jgi:hypothetical protein